MAAHEALTTIVDGLRQRQSLDQLRRSLRELLESEDLYRRALGGAFCDGMRQVADGAQPTYSSWRRFFFDWIEGYAQRYTGGFSIGRVRKTVDGLTNTWNLAKVNAGAARVYWNECARF